MTDRELRRRLLLLHAPDEIGAERRAWNVVRVAFEERQPERRPRPHLFRPLLAAAVALAVVGAVVNPPVLHAIRDAVTRERQTTVYRPALFSLPTSGRLLVNSSRGPWIVAPGGERRLLGPYREASWSPRGLYVAALGPHELVALDPTGNVRWSLARSGQLASPRWSPEIGGSTRIAYLRGQTLRMVAGDNTGDRLIAARVSPVAPAWRPGSRFVVAYVTASGGIRVVDADTQKVQWQSTPRPDRIQLAWSDDGARLAVLSPRSLVVFRGDGRRVGERRLHARAITASFQPGTHRLAVVLRYPQQSAVVLVDGDAERSTPRVVFRADGNFTGAAWSPDAAWVVISWQSADAFMFVTPQGRQNLVSDIGSQFGSRGKPSQVATVAPTSWCCRAPS